MVLLASGVKEISSFRLPGLKKGLTAKVKFLSLSKFNRFLDKDIVLPDFSVDVNPKSQGNSGYSIYINSEKFVNTADKILMTLMGLYAFNLYQRKNLIKASVSIEGYQTQTISAQETQNHYDPKELEIRGDLLDLYEGILRQNPGNIFVDVGFEISFNSRPNNLKSLYLFNKRKSYLSKVNMKNVQPSFSRDISRMEYQFFLNRCKQI